MSKSLERIFIGTREGLVVLTVSPLMNQAYDVLHAAGVLSDKRLGLCFAAEKSGQDPVIFAHKLVALCSTIQESL